jgi:hypothetical protein
MPNDTGSGMNLDKIQALRKKIAADDAASGRSVMKAYKKNRAEFEKKLAYENSKAGFDARVAKQKMAEKKKKYKATIDNSPTY